MPHARSPVGRPGRAGPSGCPAYRIEPPVVASSAFPTAALFTSSPAMALAVLVIVVVAEALLLPGVPLPGGTGVVLAGALAGAGYLPVATVAVVMVAALVVGDHAAYLLGSPLSARRRPRRPSPRPEGRWQQWSLAATPSLAGQAHVPYARLLPRLAVLRAAWFAVLFSAGLLGAHFLSSVEQAAGPGAALVGVVALALVLGSGRPRLLRALRRESLAGAGLLMLALAAAWACGGVLQDAAAHEELAHADPAVARLLADHVPDTVARMAVGAARLAQPPGLYLAGLMCVMFLDLQRRGRSTWRFALVATGGAVTALVDLLAPADSGSPAAQPGMALYFGLLLSATLLWTATMRVRALVAATLGAMLAVATMAVALLMVGTAATSVLAGALAGMAWAALVEASTRARWPAVRLRLGNGPRPGPRNGEDVAR